MLAIWMQFAVDDVPSSQYCRSAIPKAHAYIAHIIKHLTIHNSGITCTVVTICHCLHPLDARNGIWAIKPSELIKMGDNCNKIIIEMCKWEVLVMIASHQYVIWSTWHDRVCRHIELSHQNIFIMSMRAHQPEKTPKTYIEYQCEYNASISIRLCKGLFGYRERTR